MNVQDENKHDYSELEDQARTLLTESVTRIDGRIRSRLNQARQAAVAEAGKRRRWFLGSFFLMPTAGAAAAAALVALVLWHHQPQGTFPVSTEGQMSAEDLDLIADGDGLDLMQDADGSFYEWAAAQSEAGVETST
jgi:hypothetical protein